MKSNKRKLFSSKLEFEEIRLLSHEIAKKVISGELTKEEAINEVMEKADWSYGYADAAVTSWIENEPTYNGMVMSSFTLHYKNDDGEDSIWGTYGTKEEAESEIEKFRTTGFGPNPTFCEIIESSRKAVKSSFAVKIIDRHGEEDSYSWVNGDRYDSSKPEVFGTKEEAQSVAKEFNRFFYDEGLGSFYWTSVVEYNDAINSSRKAIKSNAKDDKRSYEIDRENKATLSWGDFCDSLSEDFVMDGIFRTAPGDHHWSETIGDLIVVLSVSEDNPSQGRFSLYKRGNFKKPLRTEYKRFGNADEAKEIMYQFIEFAENFDD